MPENSDILPFIRFNPMKHHRNYMLSILKNVSEDEITRLFEPVCNNYIDVYTGQLSPGEIADAVAGVLRLNGIFQPDDFIRWVEAENGYRLIRLGDRSEWILRKGDDAAQYIHIHPARTGRFTIRFKGSTLKTVFLLKASCADSTDILSIEKVNRIRMQIGLSPVKKLERHKGILKCLETFF